MMILAGEKHNLSGNLRVGRTVLVAYSFILVGGLFLAGVFFSSLITEERWSDVGYVSQVVTLHSNQTYVHNVTISYEVHQPPRGYGTRSENSSIVVEEPPFADSLTGWTRGWLPIMIELNETAPAMGTINRSLVAPDGIILPWAYTTVAAGGSFGVATPEITRGGTYRLFIQNKDSQDIHIKLSWNTDWHLYQKPYFYYGIAGLAIALLYPVLFLFRQR